MAKLEDMSIDEVMKELVEEREYLLSTPWTRVIEDIGKKIKIYDDVYNNFFISGKSPIDYFERELRNAMGIRGIIELFVKEKIISPKCNDYNELAISALENYIRIIKEADKKEIKHIINPDILEKAKREGLILSDLTTIPQNSNIDRLAIFLRAHITNLTEEMLLGFLKFDGNPYTTKTIKTALTRSNSI